MADDIQSRRLTTIVALDVAGYSARTEADEARATAEVTALRRLIEDIAGPRGGRVFNTAGDGFMLEFGSSLAAVEAAFALAEQCEPKLRVGVHLGDVVVQANGDLLGHGVNVVARLMARSDPGSVLVSGDVRRTIRGPLAARLVSRGLLHLDKMTETIEAFALATGAGVIAAPLRSREPILAVLPLDNLSDDREMQFFSDGVTEEIIQRLSRGARMKVIGRTSSFQYRGTDKTARKVRTELGCTHILDGSIRRAGGRVRIAAHLTEADSQTTLWSERYDRTLEDMFAVQDEIAERIADALALTFTSFSTKSVDPSAYDLYLRASRFQSYAPDELRTNIGLLEVAIQRAPHFADAWGRLAHLRSWLRFYEPFPDRAASAALVMREADRALELDPENLDAMTGRLFVVPPFGRFIDGDTIVERMRRSAGSGEGRKYVGWYLRTMGRIREALEEDERAYRLDPLHSMSANLVALGRMAAGRVAEAVPLYEELVERLPAMSFPVSSLLRCYAFQQDWAAVDRLLELATKRQLREFQDGLPFIRTKRDPSPQNLAAWRSALEAHSDETGRVDVSRLVYSAHLGLVEEAYRAAETARLGPAGTGDDVMGPDGYRTSLLFQAGMPELRNDRRFARLCARLGLVEFWLATDKWPDCVDEVPYDFKAECEKVRHVPIESFGF